MHTFERGIKPHPINQSILKYCSLSKSVDRSDSWWGWKKNSEKIYKMSALESYSISVLFYVSFQVRKNKSRLNRSTNFKLIKFWQKYAIQVPFGTAL